MLASLRKKTEKKTAQKPTKPTKKIKKVHPDATNVEQVDTLSTKATSIRRKSSTAAAAAAPTTTSVRDIQLPKSKQEVFKMFNLSTTNQILRVCRRIVSNGFHLSQWFLTFFAP